MQIAVVGDSHVAALKSAWEAMAAVRPGTSLTFFASRSDGLAGLRPEGDALVADNDTLRGHLQFTSGGLDRIVPAAYDMVVIYGLRFLLSAEDDDDGGVYSTAARAAARRDGFAQCLALVTLGKLRSISDIPCIIGPTPPGVSHDAGALPLSADELSAVEDALQAAALEGRGAILVGPPLAAMVRPLNADRRFVDHALKLAVGDERDGKGVRARNQRHMNAEYGALWLTRMFDRLRTLPSLADRAT
ncbi:MAG: hypothetical protein ACT4OK_02990 [Gemmobacter sp.]